MVITGRGRKRNEKNQNTIPDNVKNCGGVENLWVTKRRRREDPQTEGVEKQREGGAEGKYHIQKWGFLRITVKKISWKRSWQGNKNGETSRLGPYSWAKGAAETHQEKVPGGGPDQKKGGSGGVPGRRIHGVIKRKASRIGESGKTFKGMESTKARGGVVARD